MFLDWMISEGFFRGDRHPLVGLKKRRPRGRIVQLEEKEVQNLLKQPKRNTYSGLRDFSLMCLSIDTGIRPGEALALLPEDFHASRSEVVVRAEILKTRTPRTLPVSLTTVATIRQFFLVRPPEWGNAPIFASDIGELLSVTGWSVLR